MLQSINFHKFRKTISDLYSSLRIEMLSNQNKGEHHLSPTDSSSSEKCSVSETIDFRSYFPTNPSNSNEEEMYSVNPEYAMSIQNCPRLEKLREDTFVWMVRVYKITDCDQ